VRFDSNSGSGYHPPAMKPFTHSPRAAATLVVAAALALMATAVGGAGCSSKLETGYKPRLLGSSAEVRRGYYAKPFTPEAKKAKDYEQDFGTPGGSRDGTRPRPGN
jgi:hypothetical protein